MNKILSALILSAAFLHCFAPAPALSATLEETPTGVIVETDRYRAVIATGVVTGFLNKLTGEQYLNSAVNMQAIFPQFPAGLGTQTGEAAYKAAGELYRYPWFEVPRNLSLPNQHFPSAASKFEYKAAGDSSATLIYTGLTDGQNQFPTETYSLAVAVDAATGDLLLTPSAKSSAPGVYGVNLPFAPTQPAIAIHAPIFDGVKLTSDMADTTWHTKWPDYWDYAFLALEGERAGAVGIWAQDLEMHYKDLFYRVKDQGIALALSSMNTPPFEKLTEAQSVTWRLQAFEKSWAQAATRFRDWRLANVKFAPRPDWTKQISFVNSGVNAGKGWLDQLSAYLGGEHLERTVTFAPVIRGAAFDTKHWDNTPYPKFKEEMPVWKASGAKVMAYLQPMIMWGATPADDKEAQRIAAMSSKSNTIRPFTNNKLDGLIDQHNLAEPAWQQWFTSNVFAYINEYGADGVYHDQSYPCPVDNRGLINGLRSTQGMAEYFYKVATQSPNSIHGTEHMQEANNVGASLGIGSGVLWGTAPHMRKQRLQHPSPVSNALHYPNGTLWAFPHFSDLGTHGEATIFNWGMNQMEGRGDIAGLALQNSFYPGTPKTFDYWRNDLRLDGLRSRLFVRFGLRPVYPDDWDRNVKTYFKGAKGEEFRYEHTPWGSQFVQIEAGAKKVHYGRAYGVRQAPGAPGGIAGWLFYNDEGPTGLHPDRYYTIDPTIKRPAVYFSPGMAVVPNVPIEPTFYESYLDSSCGNDDFLLLRVKPLESVGRIIKWDRVHLHSPAEPKAVFVDGQPNKPKKISDGIYEISFQTPANICVFLKDPALLTADLKPGALARQVSTVGLDLFDSAWLTSQVVTNSRNFGTPPAPVPTLAAPARLMNATRGELHVPFRAPEKAGTLLLWFVGNDIVELLLNGVPQDVLKTPAKANPFEMKLKPNELKLVSLYNTAAPGLAFEWIEDAPPAAVK